MKGLPDFCKYSALSDVACNFFRISFTEKKRNTPDSRKSYNRVYDPADKSILPAEDPCDDIETEKTDASPVERAYDGEDKRNSVEHNITSDSHLKCPLRGTFFICMIICQCCYLSTIRILSESFDFIHKKRRFFFIKSVAFR